MTTFTISRNKLLAALIRCKYAIDPKNWKELTNYLFSFADGRLLVQSSDGELFMQESLPVEELKNADNVSFGLNRNYLLNGIKSLDEQTLRFEVMDYQARVIHNCGSFFIPRYDAECVLPDLIKKNNFLSWCKGFTPDIKGITLEIPGIKHWIDVCYNSLANDELRPVMNCVYLDFKNDNTLNVVASDGHQLTLVEKELEGNIFDNSLLFDTSLLLPRKICDVIRKALPNTGMLDLAFTEHKRECRNKDEWYQDAVGNLSVQLDADDPNHYLYIRFNNDAMNSRYPKYLSVIPRSFDYFITCDRKQLLKSINRMLNFVNPTSIIRFSANEEKLHLSCDYFDDEAGANEEIPCSFNGPQPNFRIALKGSTCASILKRISSNQVRINCVDSNTACIFEPEPQPSVESFKFLLMPMYDSELD